MTGAGASQSATPPRGTAALRLALGYALAVAVHVTPEALTRPTPCRDWDLRALLLHAIDSVAALTEGLDHGHIGLYPVADPSAVAADPGALFRQGAQRLLRSCSAADCSGGVVTIGGCPMAGSVLTMAGALEIAVHGWDISQACGQCEPIPAGLAVGLLRTAPLLVTAADRHEQFAKPVTVAVAACPSDRLAAFLGRSAS
jgi:uncharacterized protein (TIGR03086 family)